MPLNGSMAMSRAEYDAAIAAMHELCPTPPDLLAACSIVERVPISEGVGPEHD